MILLSFVLVVALALTAAWRWALAEEGTINGERASTYVDRIVEIRRVNPTARVQASLPAADVKIDPKGLVTLMKIAERRPTQFEVFIEKLRVIFPARIATKLPTRATPEIRLVVAVSLIAEASNRRWTNGSSLFLEALSVLPEGDVESMGPAAYTMSHATEAEDPLVEEIADRLLLSREQGVRDFAVSLKMKVVSPKAPPGPAWFEAANQVVQGATNLSGSFIGLPDYLRRSNADDASAKPLLLLLSKSQRENARVAAKLELWRRLPDEESVVQRAKKLMAEDGAPGFVRAIDMLTSGPISRETVPLEVAEEVISRFHKTTLARLAPSPQTGSSSPTTVFSSYRAQFQQQYQRGRLSRSPGDNVVTLCKAWAPELRPRATNLLAVLGDKQMPRSDRLAMAELLQCMPAEPPETLELLIKGLQDKSLDLEALPLLGKYGSRITNQVPQLGALLDSNDFSERRSAARFFKRATPANPAMLDRWIAGLRDSGIQAIAAEALGDYGPAASKAAPALAELVASDSSAVGLRELRLTSIATLRKIRPEYSAISVALMKAVNDKLGARLHPEIVSAAKAAILDLAPADHPDRKAAMRVP